MGSSGRSTSGSAPLLSLAHDVGDGGLGPALAQAAAWSGVSTDASGEASSGSIVLACAPGDIERLEWPNLRVLGAVG